MRRHQIDKCSIEFGFQANVMKNYERYMSRGIVAADYSPAVIEGEPAVSAVSLAALRLEAEKLRSKLTNDATLGRAFPPTLHAA
jgi:hypothetical protein